ncbi:MAG TPA: transcriptional regulator [Streptosporangiaceae bacterium]|nr:transcriptional regulator [Streptosporangiaceae bacterium]
MWRDRGVMRDEQRLAAICGLDDPVRRRLYDFVAGCCEPVGRDQAAAAIGVGRPLAAYHLDRLVGLGLLTADYRRPVGRQGPGAGRPAKVYARSDREFAVTVPPREYELAARLLAQAVEADPSGAALAGLRRAARQLGTSLARPCPPEAAAGRSALPAMRDALAAHGFEPAADPDGSLRLRNCPFRQLATRHPEVVCAMNLALLEGVAAGIGAGGLDPVLEPEPGRCCVMVRARQDTPPENMERHDT